MRQPLTGASQLGAILVARRRAMKLSQQTLAEKLSISQNRLSEIERDPGALTIDRLLELANLLDLEVSMGERDRSEKSVKPASTSW